MKKITFGKAKSEDALRISIVLKTVYIQAYATQGVTHEFANFITKKFAPEFITEKIRSDEDRYLIAYYNQNPIGVAEINYNNTCPIRNIPVPELEKLYVLERFHGQGVGFGLLNEAEKVVKKKGHHQFQLEVYIKNDRAISFYKRQGYESIGEVDFPVEDSFYRNKVMNKILTVNA